jgi:hypothetical protein
VNFKTSITFLAALIFSVLCLIFSKQQTEQVITFADNQENVKVAQLIAEHLIHLGADELEIKSLDGQLQISYQTGLDAYEIEQSIAIFLNSIDRNSDDFGNIAVNVKLSESASTSNQGCSGILLSENSNDYGRSQPNSLVAYVVNNQLEVNHLSTDLSLKKINGLHLFWSATNLILPNPRAGPTA